MDIVNQALLLATAAHAGQVDKGGYPYIFHPVNVASYLAYADYDDDHVAVALLHDVVEDTGYTLDDLRRFGFSDRIVDAVDAITRRKADGETYWDYIYRCGQNEIARVVKVHDLMDNSRITRVPPNKRGEIEGMVRSRYRRATIWLAGKDHEKRP